MSETGQLLPPEPVGRRWPRPVVFVVLLVGLALLWWPAGPRSASVAGGPAPTFALPVVGQPDRHVALADLRGRVVALVFWADRGSGVRQAVLFWQQMHQRWAPQGLVVLGMTREDDDEAVGRFCRRLGLTFVQVRPTSDCLDRYRVTGVPVSIVVDRQGWARLDYRGWDDRSAGLLADGLVHWLQAQSRPTATQPDRSPGG